jgi:hypothetical protein
MANADSNVIIRSGGLLVYRVVDGTIKYLMLRASGSNHLKGSNHWTPPKGIFQGKLFSLNEQRPSPALAPWQSLTYFHALVVESHLCQSLIGAKYLARYVRDSHLTL